MPARMFHMSGFTSPLYTSQLLCSHGRQSTAAHAPHAIQAILGANRTDTFSGATRGYPTMIGAIGL